MRSRTVRVVASAALALVTAVARGGDDDVAFAKALAQRGYSDLAERVLRRTISSGSASAAKKAETRLVLAQLRRFEAVRASRTRGPDRPAAEVVHRLFREAESAYRNLLADTQAVRAARTELAWILAAHAEHAAAFAPGESVAEILDEALRLLADAEAGARADAASAGEGTTERARADDETASVRLLLIQALRDRGAFLPGETGAAARARALSEIEKFTWDYVGTLRCAWAFRWKGLVLADMGHHREACESLRDAATAVAERDGVRGSDELAYASYEDLARTAAAAKGPGADQVAADALATVERLDGEWPRHLAAVSGRRARLASARLHLRTGDRERAAADARAVLTAAGDDDPEAAGEACRVLGDVAAVRGGTASTLPPDLLARIVRAAAQSGDASRTVGACRTLISACDTAESMDRFGWDAWMEMGRAFGAAGRWYEAYLAFDRLERAWRRDAANPRLAEITEATAYFRADALSRVAAETGDPQDRAAAERAMADFARDHPDSSFAPGAREQGAFRALAESAAMHRSGDVSGSRKRCAEAVALLAAIGPESAMFERAQAAIAEASRPLGDTGSAIRLASEWLDAERGEAPSAAARRGRDQGRAQALVTLLTAHADLASCAPAGGPGRSAAFRDLLTALTARERDFLAVFPNGRDQIDTWRAEALLETGDADLAEPLVLLLTRNRPAHPQTRYLAAANARADEAAAQGQTGKAAAEVSLRAAKLWEFVFHASETPDAEAARAAGLAFRSGGDLGHAAEFLSLAASLTRTGAEKETDAAKPAQWLDAARSLSLELARTLVGLARFEEAASECAAVLTADEPEGATALQKLSAGTALTGPEVEWAVRRAARSRAAMDLCAASLGGSTVKERLVGAVQIYSALRYTLPRNADPTVESVDLALRHADTLLRLFDASSQRDAALGASSVLDEMFGSEEAKARADALVPGAKSRIVALEKRAHEAERR